jgi:hypothetical protein
MGLLYTNISVTKNTIVDNRELAAATRKLANATYKVAESNQNIADALNEDKVTITHNRYAELLNKEKLLSSIKETIFSNLTMLLPTINTSQYKKYRETYMMGMFDKVYVIDECFKDGYCMGMDFINRTACVYRLNNNSREVNYFSYRTMEDLGYDVVGVKEPLYVEFTEGSSTITGSEYKRLLYIEDSLDNLYMGVIDILPSVMFEILNCDYTKGNNNLDNNTKFIQSAHRAINRSVGTFGDSYSIIPFVSHGYSWVLDCHNREIRVKRIE